VLTLPTRTAAMLRVDLEAAGIPYRDTAGRVVDFHALRASYITYLVRTDNLCDLLDRCVAVVAAQYGLTPPTRTRPVGWNRHSKPEEGLR
jgi:hypothetical protein